MTGISRYLLDKLSNLLEPDGKDAILGDFAELRLGLAQTTAELLGLVLRQQLRAWKNRQPWLALLLLIIVGWPVARIAVTAAFPFDRYLMTYLKYGVRYETGLSLSEDIFVWFSHSAAVLTWAWTGAFLLASLSRKTVFPIAILFYTLWAYLIGISLLSLVRGHPLALIFAAAPSLLFFAPALIGAKQGVKLGLLRRVSAIPLAAVTIAIVILMTWTDGWWLADMKRMSGGTWPGAYNWFPHLLSYLALSGPAAYLLVSSTHKSKLPNL